MNEKILLLGLVSILMAIIIWYNNSVYQAHEKGILDDKWYLIFLIIPLLVLIINMSLAKKLNKKIKNKTDNQKV